MEARYQPRHLTDNGPPWLVFCSPLCCVSGFCFVYHGGAHTCVWKKAHDEGEGEGQGTREEGEAAPEGGDVPLGPWPSDQTPPGQEGLSCPWDAHRTRYKPWECTCNSVQVLQKLISLCHSPDASLQRRSSHTQRSGHLQGDCPQTRRRDRHGRPLPLPVPWPPCDSSPTAGLDAAVAGRHLHPLLSLRVGGQTRSTETVSGIYGRGSEVPPSPRRFSAAGETDSRNSPNFICSNRLIYKPVSFIFLLGDNLQKFFSGLWRGTFSSCLSPVVDDRSCLQTPGSGPHAADTAQVGQFD